MARFSPDACRRSNSPHRTGGRRALLAGAGLACMLLAAHAQDSAAVLRVCADPGNMPLSNSQAEGYENKIAQALARDLKRQVEFTFFPQRMGFVRNTLRQRDESTQQFKCDVIIGVPKGFELTATTRPYMRSTYALVFESRDEFARLQAPEDLLTLPPARLHALRIGVFGRSPGADWLLRNDLLDHAVFYTPQSGDPAESPALVVERDLAAGKIDMAIVWGPIAGFLAGRHAQAPSWRALPFKPDSEIKFDYEISMGVRFGEKEWKDTLDQWIDTHERELRAILASYRVPLLDANGNLIVKEEERT
ncbi:MAG TPA: quinoprotein dehydrogenase-associated putative ABC transporter substrate-binding protein [Steroidobacteraceae bacterium]|nr:quinoprotein dehydrogenase-associated putative ABC transporter substrate-binding protein [Steroidobacteraceae bacterium]